METPQLISCVMPTFGRPSLVDEAVWMFLNQDYAPKELVILNDCVGQKFACDEPSVVVHNAEKRYGSLGEKRNACMELSNGSTIAVWDDDDVYLPWRLSYTQKELAQRDVPFYRAKEFWAYWGESHLHDNQAIPGWGAHPNTLFTKEIWRIVGGYPTTRAGEDAKFFDRVSDYLGVPLPTFSILRRNRFFVLRGSSPYVHMSMAGGENSLDVSPGEYKIRPMPIRDPLLRAHYEALVKLHTICDATE